jgi:hypothetical protein
MGVFSSPIAICAVHFRWLTAICRDFIGLKMWLQLEEEGWYIIEHFFFFPYWNWVDFFKSLFSQTEKNWED